MVTKTLETLPDGWPGIVLTLQRAAALVRAARLDPECREKAAAICRDAGIKGHDFDGEIKALFEHCRDNITYRNDPFNCELIQDWKRSEQYGIGDCDDKTIALCSYLAALGHWPGFIVFAEPNADRATHIFAEVQNNAGRVSLDPTVETALVGWEPDWGNTWSFPIFDLDTEGMGGMHYGSHHNNRARGMGDFFDFGSFTPSYVAPPNDPVTVPPFNPNYDPYEGLDTNAAGQLVINPNAPGAPQQTQPPLSTTNVSQWPQLIAADVAAGLKTIQSIWGNPATTAAQNPVVAQPYYQPVNQAGAGVNATLGANGLNVGVNSGLLWIGGALLAVFFITKMMSKK